MSNFNKSSNISIERKEQESFSTIPNTAATTTLDKNVQGAEHKLDPSLSFELKYHTPLHHVNQSQIHDASKPLLQTSTDIPIAQQQHSSQSSSTINEIKSMASNISNKASELSHAAVNKINELGKDVFPSSSASTVLAPQQQQQHILPQDVKQEVLHHAPLHHVSKADIDDQSAPVLSTPTDTLLPKQTSTSSTIASTLSSTAHTVAEKLEHVGASISQSADRLYDKVISSMSPKSNQAQKLNTNVPLVRHTLPPDVKQEVLHHAPLHHVSRAEIDDQSAPVLTTPTDTLLPKTASNSTSSNISAQLSSTAHTVAEKLEHMADTISHKAAEVYHSIASNQPHSTTMASNQPPLVRHTLPPDVKQEVLHHAPLHHVSRADIDDQSAPVLSTPTDNLLPKQQESTTSTIASTLSSTAHVVADKLSDVGASISKAYNQMTAPSTTTMSSTPSSQQPLSRYSSHIIKPELANAIKYNQPQLKHVPTSDHSAPVLKTETDQFLPRVSHHNIGIATPQNPHVQLHPGKVKLDHVQSTIPHDHSNNLLTNQKFDGTAYEVNEGGLGWSIPNENISSSKLDSSSSSQPTIASQTITTTTNTTTPSA